MNPRESEGDRNVRRRLNEDDPGLLRGTADCGLSILHVSLQCQKILAHQTGSEPAEILRNSVVPAVQMDALVEDHVMHLLEWHSKGMHPHRDISAARRAKWDSYRWQEKWIYHATELMNQFMRWRYDDMDCSFFPLADNPAEGFQVVSTCHIQVTWLGTLVQRWNERVKATHREPLEVVIYVSIEHWWFGYCTRDDGETKVVPMSFDESADNGRIIVNRLENDGDINDFECVVHQNTLLVHHAKSIEPPSLPLSNLEFLLLGRLCHLLLDLYAQRGNHDHPHDGGAPSPTVRLEADIWGTINAMRSQDVSDAVDKTCSWEIGRALQLGLTPPTDLQDGYKHPLEAFEAALRWNSANYLVRRALIETYLEMNEAYLAHQHCLHIQEQLAQQVRDYEAEAPIAVTVLDYAAELLDTTLAEVHQLHLRGEEGYEILPVVPGVGTAVEVQWALDDELVYYSGVVAVHPDGRSLCISYADDTEPGQHRRRFESALHLVNINDPQDTYLECYFLRDNGPPSSTTGSDEVGAVVETEGRGA